MQLGHAPAGGHHAGRTSRRGRRHHLPDRRNIMKRQLILTIGGLWVASGLTACSAVGLAHRVPDLVPAPAPVTTTKPACPAGEVIVIDDEPTDCDLVAGVNTLTIQWPGFDGYDDAAARQDAADAGCAFEVRDGVATGTNCDF